MMLVFAGRQGVEGRPARGGTALRLLDRSNATGLPPALGWKGFNNLSHPTALEFNPNKVTPELLDHLSKFVENPEQFIQKDQQQREQDIQKQVQRQEMRRLTEEAQKNPEVLKSLRELFKEMPGKESCEASRRKLDKGAERLTLDKIDPEVLRNVRKMLTEKTPISDQQTNAT
jgi:hypothetical protein